MSRWAHLAGAVMVRSLDKTKLTEKMTERRAAPEVSLIDEEQRKIPFILISKNNEGERTDWWTGEKYIERLDVTGANTERLKTFFKDHDRGVDSAIGRVENVRVENGELKADVIFGSSPEAEAIFEKYRDGILTDVSIGYLVNTVTIEERKDEPDIVTITDFDVLELSAVGIGFDQGATVGRQHNTQQGEDMTPEQIARLRELEAMKERNEELERELETLRALQASEEGGDDKLRAELEETKRREEIRAIALRYDVDNETVERFVADQSKTPQDFTRHLLDERSAKQPRVFAGRQSDQRHDDMIRAMADGLLMRHGVAPKEPHKDAEMFRGMSVQNMIRQVAGLGLDADEKTLMRAMTTSDFPLILANVQNKVVQDSFESAPVTFREWTQATEFRDFKKRTEVRKGSFGSDFKRVKELGRTEYVEKGETGITWGIESFGARFAFTRELLINDDLGLFIDDLQDMVEQVAIFQNRKVYQMLEGTGEYAGYTMEDGKPIFDAAHKNYDATGAAPSVATLSAARTKMMRQKDFDGRQLRILPKFLIVPPELEAIAYQLLNSTADIEANNAGAVNPVRNLYTPITDMELSDADAWYLAAARKTIKVGYLQGSNRRPIIEEVARSPINGIEYEMVFDFGLVAEDFRGLYKNAGK